MCALLLQVKCMCGGCVAVHGCLVLLQRRSAAQCTKADCAADTAWLHLTVYGVQHAVHQQAGWCCPQKWSRYKSTSTQCSHSDGGHARPCSQC